MEITCHVTTPPAGEIEKNLTLSPSREEGATKSEESEPEMEMIGEGQEIREENLEESDHTSFQSREEEATKLEESEPEIGRSRGGR